MRKFIFSDIRKNLNLFLGTFIAILVTSSIVCSCLNLVFSSTNTFDYGHRFDNVDIVAVANQNVVITYPDDGDIEKEEENVSGRIPINDNQLINLENQYDIIKDYTFNIEISGAKNLKVAGHNYSSIDLTGFKVKGNSPSETEIVVDENLQKRYKLKIGDNINIITNDSINKFEISGIASSNIDDVYKIQNFVFFNDEVAKNNSLGCQGVGINTNNVKSVKNDLTDKGYKVYSGNKINKAELSSIANVDISLMVIFITMGSLCLVISLFVISGAVQFSIKNRFKTLAQLRIIGLTKRQIKRALSVQTAYIGLFGALLGAIAAGPMAKLIIKAYVLFEIVPSDFVITNSWLWNGCVVLGVMLLSMMVTVITANKPLSVAPASAIKQEGEFTSKPSVISIIFGIILILGGISILIFTPITKGIGIGMGFCASSVLLAGAICLTPVIMKLFNVIFSVVVKRFNKSLGQVASANIKIKASKFAVAAVSISIMITMGTVMLLNNITFVNSLAFEQYDLFRDYKYTSSGKYYYDIENEDVLGIKNTKLVIERNNKLQSLDAMAVYGGVPNIKIIQKTDNVSQNTIWIGDNVKKLGLGDKVNLYLENGQKIECTVGGIFKTNGIQDESFGCIVDFNTIKNSLYNVKFDLVYSKTPNDGYMLNTKDFYKSSKSYDIQLAASLLLGVISLSLSIVALFNTFAVIMSVRKKEFNGLKVIGARKSQIFKMTFIETLIVTITGLIIGFVILITCVGMYSQANTGIFDFIVDDTIFYGTIIITTILSFLGGLIPSLITISKLKRQFRDE